MRVLVPYAMKNGQSPAASPAKLQSPLRVRCPCSSRPPSRLPPKPSVSMPSSFIGTTATNWEFIPGNSCGTGVPARNARRQGLSPRHRSRNNSLDFSGTNHSGAFTAPSGNFSISRTAFTDAGPWAMTMTEEATACPGGVRSQRRCCLPTVDARTEDVLHEAPRAQFAAPVLPPGGTFGRR